MCQSRRCGGGSHTHDPVGHTHAPLGAHNRISSVTGMSDGRTPVRTKIQKNKPLADHLVLLCSPRDTGPGRDE